MAELFGGFDATKIEANDFKPIPAGWYQVVITQSEWNPTKDGKGKFLKFTLEIINGEYKKRQLFDRLNLVNKSQTAVEIAQRTLSTICHSVNVLCPKDTIELHNLPFEAKIAIEKGNDGDFQNIIKGYRKKSEVQISQVEQSQENKKPWER